MHEADLASSDLQERARCGSSVRAELQQEDVSRNQSSGSGSSGSFQFVASDTAAYTDLAAIEVVINSVFSGAQACYLRYDQSPNRLWLVNDAGALFTGPPRSRSLVEKQPRLGVSKPRRLIACLLGSVAFAIGRPAASTCRRRASAASRA